LELLERSAGIFDLGLDFLRANEAASISRSGPQKFENRSFVEVGEKPASCVK
jgi:hypothetical protein